MPTTKVRKVGSADYFDKNAEIIWYGDMPLLNEKVTRVVVDGKAYKVAEIYIDTSPQEAGIGIIQVVFVK